MFQTFPLLWFILYYLFIFLHQFSLVTHILYSHKTTVMFWLSVSGCYCNVLGKDNNEPRTLTHFITDKHLGSVSLFRKKIVAPGNNQTIATSWCNPPHFYQNKNYLKAERSEVLTSHSGSAPSGRMSSRWKTTQQVDFPGRSIETPPSLLHRDKLSGRMSAAEMSGMERLFLKEKAFPPANRSTQDRTGCSRGRGAGLSA